MSATFAGLVTFVAVSAAAMLGKMLSPHMSSWGDASALGDSLKSSMTLVATMTSLVLGLLVNSSYSNYAEAEKDLERYAATLVLTDQSLIGLGEAACPLRPDLQRYASNVVASIWPSDTAAQNPDATTMGNANMMILLAMLQKAQGFDGHRKEMRGLLQEHGERLVENAWKISNYGSGRMATTFLAAIIFWLALVYGGIGFAMPDTRLAVCGVLISAVGVALAIFLAAEMTEPFGGPLRVARTPLTDAIQLMQQLPCPAKS